MNQVTPQKYIYSLSIERHTSSKPTPTKRSRPEAGGTKPEAGALKAGTPRPRPMYRNSRHQDQQIQGTANTRNRTIFTIFNRSFFLKCLLLANNLLQEFQQVEKQSFLSQKAEKWCFGQGPDSNLCPERAVLNGCDLLVCDSGLLNCLASLFLNSEGSDRNRSMLIMLQAFLVLIDQWFLVLTAAGLFDAYKGSQMVWEVREWLISCFVMLVNDMLHTLNA